MTRLYKFSAAWCMPCKQLSKVISGVVNETTQQMREIDIDKEPEMAKHYSIRSVPTLIMIDDSANEIRRKTGMMDEATFKKFIGEE